MTEEIKEGYDWSDGENALQNEWLPKTGTFIVYVVAARNFYANSGTDGIEITMADEKGRKIKDTLWNTEKSISRNWGICMKLGIPIAVMKNVTPEAFVGRYCKITTKADGKYTAIDEWENWHPTKKEEAFIPVLIKPEEEQWTPDKANSDTPFTKDDVPF